MLAEIDVAHRIDHVRIRRGDERPGVEALLPHRKDVVSLAECLLGADLHADVEPRLKRPVEAHQHRPALAGYGLHPVALLAGGRGRREPDGEGTVRVGLQFGALAVDVSAPLVGLQQAAVLSGVDDEGPELPGRDGRRQGHAVGLAAVEVPALRIVGRERVGRSLAHLGMRHRRGDARGHVVHLRPVVEHELAVAHEFVPAADEGRVPLPVLVEVGLPAPRAEAEGPRRRVPDGGGLREDLLHAPVGSEGSALLDADRGPQTDQLGVERVGRLILNERRSTPRRARSRWHGSCCTGPRSGPRSAARAGSSLRPGGTGASAS